MRLDHITPKQFASNDQIAVTVKMTRTESLRHERHLTDYHISDLLKRAAGHDSVPEFLDDHRALEPPDPIPNSVVKRCIADGSVGFPHVRVGHRQD